MAAKADFMNRLIPISQFNKGMASKIFDRVKQVGDMVVLKNNKPCAVIMSPEEYERLIEVEEDFILYELAMERWEKEKDLPKITWEESLAEFGITQEELDAMPDPVIE